MSRLNQDNFIRVVREIEKAEFFDENIWIAVGLLELLQDDDIGYIDYYFHLPREERNVEKLWEKVK